MYTCLCHLAVNELCGSTAILPHLMTNLLSESKTISYNACFAQVFFIYTYGTVELTILTVMAYDRYVAICNPLRYSNIMTDEKTHKLLIIAWVYSSLSTLIVVVLSHRLPLCSLKLDKLFCDNVTIMNMSCVDASINNILTIFLAFIDLVIPLLVIVYSYLRILIVCLKASKEAWAKALNTCLSHLLTFFIFIIGIFAVVLGNRIKTKAVPVSVNNILSLGFLTIPPLFNPIIYGMKTESIRTGIKNILRKRIASKPGKQINKIQFIHPN
ncbi:olfactory receptor 4E2 [Latimeria chalumnae]|uniref:olfactory receptor 4E2 n=1 Tax=Latimeria chalumnae TaxID=7897 RepID=UPI0006D8FEA1|nr:PREDICTED: olfactory receptor 142 [Latimeria chalumnae]|eukprot:XP_006012085.2 PREDICTED: olfactory receptor 142 [Latimeria chalumnae]